MPADAACKHGRVLLPPIFPAAYALEDESRRIGDAYQVSTPKENIPNSEKSLSTAKQPRAMLCQTDRACCCKLVTFCASQREHQLDV